VTSHAHPIDRLAKLCRVETRFHDARGQTHVTPPESTRAILTAMGVPCGSYTEIRDAIAAAEAETRSRLLPRALIVRRGSGPVMLANGAKWRLELEDGGVTEGAAADNVDTTGLPIGVHRLTVSRGRRTDSATLLASPEAAPDVRALSGRKKLWGVAAPLYGLRSDRNLGLGTYGDLGELAEAIGPMGADYLAINPVHALFPLEPRHFSPYSPTHRRFFNTAHIDGQAVPEFAASEAAQGWLSQHAAEIERLRGAELIDYPAVAALHQPLLERLFETFEATCPAGSPRAEAFSDWCAGRGAELERFATHQALSEQFGLIWHDWPEALHHPGAPEVARFAAEHGRRIRFHKYLQWLASEQLDAAQSRAHAAGMGLGLVADLAVGVSPDGAALRPRRVARGAARRLQFRGPELAPGAVPA
jgi:4-alpha-glucanotransferase